jgi:hypothetical protein
VTPADCKSDIQVLNVESSEDPGPLSGLTTTTIGTFGYEDRAWIIDCHELPGLVYSGMITPESDTEEDADSTEGMMGTSNKAVSSM